MTTSTIPTAAKRKEIVRHGPLSLCILSAHRGMGQIEGRKSLFLAISMAGKVVVDCVGLYVVVIRVGYAAEYSRFSLGDPSL
jgi:hypothetical protein